MELVKKHYKKIISYGLVVFGIMILAAIFIIRPSRIIFKEIYNYPATPEISKINFPLLETITIDNPDLSFIELRFEDESINQYQYKITLAHDSETLFEHQYANEISNIIRMPISNENLASGDKIQLKLQCVDHCENAKIAMYDIDGEKHPKILTASYKPDISFYWYGFFPIVVGLTLLPFSKEKE